MFDHNNIVQNVKRNPNFQYGNAQAAISLFILVITFIGNELNAKNSKFVLNKKESNDFV